MTKMTTTYNCSRWSHSEKAMDPSNPRIGDMHSLILCV